MIYLIIRWRIRVNNNKNLITQQLLELRSSALRAQMNPHFTYNALNSIQSLIASDDMEKASIYLAEFSNLMRMALEASSKELVTLEEEIDIVKHYLLLEKLRFKEKFIYTIDIEPNIALKKIEVPPMIIQPFVENAIIHGLLPKQKPGKVSIRITQNDGALSILVIDDGIGVNQAAKKKIPGATSRGLEITRSRIHLLDKRNELTISSVDGNGTTIKIKLHVNL